MKKLVLILLMALIVSPAFAAKQMSYTDESGVTHAASYWIPVDFNINKLEQVGYVLFYGYATQSARNDLKAPIAKKKYRINPDNFDSYYSVSAAQAMYDNAYDLADDTVEGPEPAEGEEDNRVSFFDGASDI